MIQIWGLSPRVRGSPEVVLDGKEYTRIIPACAGKPPPIWTRTTTFRDYPRVCGEAGGTTPSIKLSSGLSPRVRGSPRRRLPSAPRPRIIPACAGKPRRITPTCPVYADYPRVCGEAPSPRRWRESPSGLSPRVRGSRRHHAVDQAVLGIIPACAGKPAPSSPKRSSPADYPRVCGEAAPDHADLPGVRGLSPRVRGSLQHQVRLHRQDGIIPACAGKPTLEEEL